MPKTVEIQSVVQDWVAALPFQQQAVLFMALRGPDNVPKESAAKKLLHLYRGCILHPAFHMEETIPYEYKWNCYMVHPSNVGTPYFTEVADAFMKGVDEYPLHFYLHLLHAIEILGYKHPDLHIKMEWTRLYFYMCDSMHVTPELHRELDERLKR